MTIKFQRRFRTKAALDMVPMIDIIFQLIIFFMVATTVKTTTGFELDLPKAEYVDAISTSSLKITIIDKDNIVVGSKKTDLSNFENFLKSDSSNNVYKKQSVIIYGSDKMEYQLLIDVMDILRIYEYDNIDLAIKKKDLF